MHFKHKLSYKITRYTFRERLQAQLRLICVKIIHVFRSEQENIVGGHGECECCPGLAIPSLHLHDHFIRGDGEIAN